MAIVSRNIFGWLGMKQEQAMLRDAQQHVDVTYETVVNFKKAVKAFIDGDFKKRAKLVDLVRKNEREADALRSKMVDLLSESPLMPPDREDLMHFVKTLDRIADWTCGTARLLNFLEEKLPEDITRNISIATDIICDSISNLKDAIHAISKNDLKQVIKDCHEVEECESKADDQKQILISAIIHSNLEANKLIVDYHLAETLEGITDKIEDASDFIKTIAITSR